MSWNLTTEWLENIAAQQLLGVAIASTALCLVGLLAARCTRASSAAARFCIWQMVGCGIVVSTAVLVLAPGISLRSTPPPAIVSISPIPHALNVSSPIRPAGPAPVLTQTVDVARAAQLAELQSVEAHSVAASPVSRLPVRTDSVDIARVDWFSRALVLLVSLWGVLALGQFLWFLRNVAICYKTARLASAEVPDWAAFVMQRARKRIGARADRTIELLISDAVSVPFAIGIFRPAVVLPVACSAWTPQKLESVLAHELAHIQRHDILWHWTSRLACCIAWFNPLVWLAIRRGLFERERACDDRVIDSGINAVNYAKNLVEIAAAMSGRQWPLAGSVSMAEPPLKKRLFWILSTAADRRRLSLTGYCITAVLFLVLACSLGVIRPLATVAIASEPKTQEDSRQDNDSSSAPKLDEEIENVQLPTSLRGYVTDVDGRPIADARVEVKLVDFGHSERHREARELTIQRWTVTTDAQGAYLLDPSSLGKVPAHYCFGSARVWADGFAVGTGRYWPTAEEVAAGEEIKAAQLQKGRKVFGLVRNAGGEPTSAIIKGAAANDDLNDWWVLEGEEVAEDGEFELWVPESKGVELIVYAPGFAPKRVALASDQHNAGKIVLSTGTKVTGQLLDRAGQPVAGAVIAMDSHDDSDLVGIAFGTSFAVLSDQAGKFELPPATGKCRIWTAKSAARTDTLGRETVTGIQPPLVIPIVLNLSEGGGSEQLILREAETQVVTGTVRWENGEPVADFEITGGVMVEDAGIELTYTQTDAESRYRMELPRPLTDVYLNAFGQRDDDGVWHMAYGRVDPPGRGSGQFISFDNLDGDIGGADWELRRYRTPVPVSVAQQKAEKEFAKLKTMEEEARETYSAAMEAATTPEEQDRIYTELDPRNAMVSYYLAFEREHRGDTTALRAIGEILQGANSVGDPETKVAKARNEAVERLIDHYLGHEDLATAFSSLDGGPDVPRADTLLRLASERSPHRQVRAAALLARAERIKTKLRYAQMLPELEQLVAEILLKDPPPSVRAEMTRRIEELRSMDLEALRSQANEWLDTIIREYSEIIKPNDFDNVTYGKAAEYLKFAINNVIVGGPAPELTAVDIEGKPFRLSDLRGQVVVLTFWHSIFDSADGLPNQEIAQEFSGRPLKLVTIMGTADNEKFTAALKDKSYAGTIIWDPLNGPIQRTWGLDHYPTTFVIDQHGTLVSTEVMPEKLTERLQALLD